MPYFRTYKEANSCCPTVPLPAPPQKPDFKISYVQLVVIFRMEIGRRGVANEESMCPTEKPEYKNLVLKKMCRVIHLYMLAIVLSVVSSMGVIPQSILLFILKRMLHIFKNKSFKIPFGEILFPILRPCGRGVA